MGRAAAKLVAKGKKELREEQRRNAQAKLVDQLRQDIARVAAQDKPVLVGPFTGEVGFELLYWMPLVRWAVREFPSLRGRLIIVSRGGVEHWWRSYLGELTYVDILSFADPKEYVARKGVDKQRTVKDFDEELLAKVRARLGLGDAAVLHPSLLFNFYYQVRKGELDAFVNAVRPRTGGADGLAALYDPISAPELDAAVGALLPDDFVAVRFYFRESFPDTAENRAFAAAVLEGLARRQQVVLLNNRLELDEHSDFVHGVDGVVTLDHLMTPDNNLHIQSVALARARAFVGTYGGLSYLAPFLGVPAVGFSSDPDSAAWWHLALAQKLFEGEQWAPLVTLRAADLPLISIVARDLPLEPFEQALGRRRDAVAG